MIKWKRHMNIDDIQEHFWKYDFYILLSVINPTNEIDRTLEFFLDFIAEQIFDYIYKEIP